MLGRIFRASRRVLVDSKAAAPVAQAPVAQAAEDTASASHINFDVQEFLVKQGNPSFSKFYQGTVIPEKYGQSGSHYGIDPHEGFNLERIRVPNTHVIIYKPTANAMQNESNDNYAWHIREPVDNGCYTDYVTGVDVAPPPAYPIFETIEQAVAYCDRSNLQYQILKDNHRTYKHGKSYATNFRFKGDTPRPAF